MVYLIFFIKLFIHPSLYSSIFLSHYGLMGHLRNRQKREIRSRDKPIIDKPVLVREAEWSQ